MKGRNMKFILALVMGVFVTPLAQAQSPLKYLEIGGYVGSMNYRGDVSSTGNFNAFLKEVRAQGGIHIKYHFGPIFSMGAEAGVGQIYGHDYNHGNVDRGFEISSVLFQVNAISEINFRKFGKYYQKTTNTPYIRLGVGALSYSPSFPENTAVASNVEIYPNSYFGVNYSFGFGWKWRVGMNSSLGVDLTYHFTNVDNLDGFEIVDDIPGNDRYFGLRLVYGYMIFKK